MSKALGMRWLSVVAGATMLLAVAAACTETVEVPGETVVVEKEVIKEVQVPGETVVVKEEVVKTVEVPGETVVKEVVRTVEVPGETVVVEKEVIKEVQVPGETVVVEKEVVKVVEVPVQAPEIVESMGEVVIASAEVPPLVGLPSKDGGGTIGGHGVIWSIYDPIVRAPFFLRRNGQAWRAGRQEWGSLSHGRSLPISPG